MEVNVSDLRRYFGKTKAVNGVNFSFASGDVFGFVGPNGAGKTTTLRILATLDVPTSGDATIDGVSVVQYPEKTRQKVGFMADTLPTHSDIIVREYIDFFARAYGLRGKHRKKAIDKVEEFTGLSSLNQKLLRSLSKGMKQRVSLARAIIHDPTVLILDEPASGLDPRARIELRELISVLSDHGKAILISSHILTELSGLCNGAVVIEKGNILKAGTIDRIIKEAMPGNRLTIRLAEGDLEALKRELLLFPGVTNATVQGDNSVMIDITGDDDASSNILTAMIGKGFRICDFHGQQADLERIFMDITEGEVQ